MFAADGPRRADGRRATLTLGASHEIREAPAIYASVRDLIERLPQGGRVLLRRPWRGEPGFFEQATAEICRRMGVIYEWRFPLPGQGREATYFRDISMIEESDFCIVFFDPSAIMQGGTAHLVEKCLDQRCPVYAFTLDEQGLVIRVGEHEPDTIPLGGFAHSQEGL